MKVGYNNATSTAYTSSPTRNTTKTPLYVAVWLRFLTLNNLWQEKGNNAGGMASTLSPPKQKSVGFARTYEGILEVAA